MYRPMVAILVAAENATELPKLGRPRIKLSVHASQTAVCRVVCCYQPLNRLERTDLWGGVGGEGETYRS